MNFSRIKLTFPVLLILITLVLVSCGNQAAQVVSVEAEEPSSASQVQESTNTLTDEPIETSDGEIQPTAAETSANDTENEDVPQQTVESEQIPPREILTREVPEDFNWKDQPIIPEISETAFEIFEYGLASGRNPENISVIGDCQAIPFVFLGKYGLGQYTLDPVDGYLEKMIEYYRASFQREGFAVRGGFTAAAVLSPVRADPDGCMPGENPLDCEWRVQNPSIVFINLETWREEGTVDRYELYLEKIVEYALERGTLPIIIMKADKAESENHVINPAMARVAYKYDIPLINFWRSAQYLENKGIDAEREGFHLSEAGYDLKQTLAMRILYQVWDMELNQDITDTSPEENSQETEPELVESENNSQETTLLSFPAFNCLDNCVYFDRFTTGSDGVVSEGIYEMNLDTREFELITPSGVSLQDGLSTQQTFLINKDQELYLVDKQKETITLLLDNLYPTGGSSAYFSEDAALITTIITNSNQQSIVQVDLEDLSQTELVSSEFTPIQLLPYRPADAVYWTSGTCSSQDFCQITGTWQTNLANDNIHSEIITEKEKLVFSPDGSGMAFRDPQYADDSNYFHNPILLAEDTAAGIQSRRLFFFPHPGGFMVHPEITSYVFSPDSSKIFVLQDAYSDYFEKSVALHFYLEDLDLRMVFEHGQLEGAYGSLSPQVLWSPDNDEILLLLINTSNDREYTFEIYQKDILDRFSEISTIIEPIKLDNYSYLHKAVWLKDTEE